MVFFALSRIHKHTAKGSTLHNIVDTLLPRLWKPLPTPTVSGENSAKRHRASSAQLTTVSSITGTSVSYPSVISLPEESPNDDNNNPTDEQASLPSMSEHLSSITTATHTLYNSTTTANSTAVVAPVKRDLFLTYFDANQVLISLLTFLGIMVTYGVVFPPLGVALLVTIFSVVYMSKLKIGRFLTLATDANQLHFVQIIERECRCIGSTRILINSVWFLVLFSCYFYSLFLFDTLGDKRGFKESYWVLIVMILMPCVLFGVYYSHTLYILLCNILCPTKEVDVSGLSGDVQSVELRPTGSSKTYTSERVTEETLNVLVHSEDERSQGSEMA